jgi:hypothetical protein
MQDHDRQRVRRFEGKKVGEAVDKRLAATESNVLTLSPSQLLLFTGR